MVQPNVHADAMAAVAELLSQDWTDIDQLAILACASMDAHGKRARARRHWAKARAFVHIYPYALFWHTSMCEQFCAPGGKWAERDRTAFEADFKCP